MKHVATIAFYHLTQTLNIGTVEQESASHKSIHTWVLFTNDNVLSCLLSLLQLNEGEPAMFLLKNHPDPSASRCYNSGKQDSTQIQPQADVVIVVNKTRPRSKNKKML